MPGALSRAATRGAHSTATKAFRMAPAPAPEMLTLERHRNLKGLYTSGLVARRVGYALLATVSVLGLLNVFGQRPTTATADAGAASLQLYAPSHLRGGLL